PGSADLVVSSLALHYVADYTGLVARIATWLRPGGRLVFSVEHPVCTARDPMAGWVRAGRAGDAGHDDRVWAVDDYADEGPRTQTWFVDGVLKYHRRVSTLVNGLLAAGLALLAVVEPVPDPDEVDRRPDLADELRRPSFLMLAAQRPRHAAASDGGPPAPRQDSGTPSVR
ncbi:class I SAM-dependent methyltransferase, partial [Marinitenerispora sediminis]